MNIVTFDYSCEEINNVFFLFLFEYYFCNDRPFLYI